MNSLDIPTRSDHRIFYLSSCESGTGIDLRESPRSSISSSSSSLHLETLPTTNLSNNLFLRVLKHLRCLTIRRRKNGRFRALSSSLHLFFKKNPSLVSSSEQFHKSPSSPDCLSNPIDKINVLKSNHSDQQLYSNVNVKQNVEMSTNLHRSFRRKRRSDKTVSEDNNTNTLSSVDLSILPPPLLIVTDVNSPFKTVSVLCNQSMSAKVFFFPIHI